MTGKISDFLQKRRSARLFKQWVKTGNLPPEEVPLDLQRYQKKRAYQHSANELGAPLEDVQDDEGYTTGYSHSRMVNIPIRYLFLGLGLLALLLVVLAIVSTILVMRSC